MALLISQVLDWTGEISYACAYFTVFNDWASYPQTLRVIAMVTFRLVMHHVLSAHLMSGEVGLIRHFRNVERRWVPSHYQHATTGW